MARLDEILVTHWKQGAGCARGVPHRPLNLDVREDRSPDQRRTRMCGIAGEIRFGGSAPDVEAVARITAEMHRRGPDGSGIYSVGAIALGHRRLKIIDLSERGAQPMVDPELGLSAVF